MSIPGALGDAHAELDSALNEAMISWNEHHRFDPAPIIESIERFYIAVGKVPYLLAELSKRAALYHLQIELPQDARTLRLEYEHLQIEGCWFLLHGGRGAASEEWDAEARAVLESNFGGGQLKGIRIAAIRLLEFAAYTEDTHRCTVDPSATPLARDQFKWLCGEIIARLDETDAKNDLRNVGDIQHFVSQLNHAAAAIGVNRCPIRFDAEVTEDGKLGRGVQWSDPDGHRGGDMAVSLSEIDADGNAIGGIETIWGGERRAREIRATIRECLNRWIRWVDRPAGVCKLHGKPAAMADSDDKSDGKTPKVSAADDETLSMPQLAERWNLTDQQRNNLKSRLTRWRADAPSADYVEAKNTAKNQPTFLYRVGAVRQILDAIASG